MDKALRLRREQHRTGCEALEQCQEKLCICHWETDFGEMRQECQLWGKTQLGGKIAQFSGGRLGGVSGSCWANLRNFPGEHRAGHPTQIYIIYLGKIVWTTKGTGRKICVIFQRSTRSGYGSCQSKLRNLERQSGPRKFCVVLGSSARSLRSGPVDRGLSGRQIIWVIN